MSSPARPADDELYHGQQAENHHVGPLAGSPARRLPPTPPGRRGTLLPLPEPLPYPPHGLGVQSPDQPDMQHQQEQERRRRLPSVPRDLALATLAPALRSAVHRRVSDSLRHSQEAIQLRNDALLHGVTTSQTVHHSRSPAEGHTGLHRSSLAHQAVAFRVQALLERGSHAGPRPGSDPTTAANPHAARPSGSPLHQRHSLPIDLRLQTGNLGFEDEDTSAARVLNGCNTELQPTPQALDRNVVQRHEPGHTGDWLMHAGRPQLPSAQPPASHLPLLEASQPWHRPTRENLRSSLWRQQPNQTVEEPSRIDESDGPELDADVLGPPTTSHVPRFAALGSPRFGILSLEEELLALNSPAHSLTDLTALPEEGHAFGACLRVDRSPRAEMPSDLRHLVQRLTQQQREAIATENWGWNRKLAREALTSTSLTNAGASAASLPPARRRLSSPASAPGPSRPRLGPGSTPQASSQVASPNAGLRARLLAMRQALDQDTVAPTGVVESSEAPQLLRPSPPTSPSLRRAAAGLPTQLGIEWLQDPRWKWDLQPKHDRVSRAIDDR